MRRVSAWAMSGLAERLTPLELTPTEASTLVLISVNAGITQSEIGRMLGIVSANMAPLIARLEQRALVERVPVNGRSFGLKLSRQGANITSAARQAMADQERQLMKQVPADLRPVFKNALQAILASLEN